MDINDIISDPKNRELLQVVKSMRNGLIYGGKLRFAHTLVMQFIFKRHSPLSSKLSAVVKMARAHGTILAVYAFIYRAVLMALKRVSGREAPIHEFISGAIGGLIVYGNLTPWFNHSITHQITLFCGARVTLALGKLMAFRLAKELKLLQRESRLPLVSSTEHLHLKKLIQRYSWSTFATVSWGVVMYLHRYYPTFLQHGLESSMEFIYDDYNWNDWRSLLGV
ncbi:PMP4 [Cyberlindnera jadinii]|uniref:PMP4 protein n=1 Tax=Cyberlindnera jadinii (strain ATCC 18201 / CBS 1600 / BCRC 20928 / JCM 3617 / NBRC 0987 / NRRL Y-1542) TaxID=983966 RepID=A0A0H5C3Z9_CYBJN|nr:PMP4 [Cyberlindnera jadinii]